MSKLQTVRSNESLFTTYAIAVIKPKDHDWRPGGDDPDNFKILDFLAERLTLRQANRAARNINKERRLPAGQFAHVVFQALANQCSRASTPGSAVACV